jgi:hypothetical protein
VLGRRLAERPKFYLTCDGWLQKGVAAGRLIVIPLPFKRHKPRSRHAGGD